MRSPTQQLICFALSALLAAPLRPADHSARSLADFSLEELLNESVTSVSKRQTRLSESPAAITLVNPEDIRRLGITTLPEALRLVPGMAVARVSASKWAVTARGFNGQFANKLLVLIDGRAVYTPAFAGVYWDSQDVMLDDVDRIEVIRGPGATLWGSNAVNGVINVATKSARETQGLLTSATVGTEDRPGMSVRYGGRLAREVFYRAYVKYFDRANFVDHVGNDTPDAWHSFRAGLRVDGSLSSATGFTMLADYRTGESGEYKTRAMLTPPFSQQFNAVGMNRGGNILGRWTRELGANSALTLQAYYDYFEQNAGTNTNQETRDTLDFELQHRFAIGSRQQIVWGTGYRHSADRLASNFGIIWTPESNRTSLANAFVQDEISLLPQRLQLIVGSKLEHNEFTGFEVQPNVRLLWTPNARQSIWAAASRAVRTPSRFDRDVRLNVAAFQPSAVSPPFLVSLFGNPGVDSEKLTAYEAGYRHEVSRDLTFDFAAFYNVYRDLLTFVPGPNRFEATPAPAHILIAPSTMQNADCARSHGTELSAQWRVSDRWKLVAGYSWLAMHRKGANTSGNESPKHQGHLRSYFDLPRNLQLNGSVAYIGGMSGQQIPSFVRLDLGVRWRASEALEFGVWGQNLLDPQHPEIRTTTSALQTEVPRSIVGKVTWRY